jgi:hypothetical protein
MKRQYRVIPEGFPTAREAASAASFLRFTRPAAAPQIPAGSPHN